MHDRFRLVGATIDCKYRIDEVVGEGGFGVVYRAFHTGFKAPIAVKVLKEPEGLAAAAREKFLAAFENEGALLFQLARAHHAFVQVTEKGVVGTPAGPTAPYLVMEWLEGESLATDLDRRRAAGQGGRSLPEALALLEPIAQALGVAHAWKPNAVVHRDVKPANIFLARAAHGEPSAKLLDFGIAKVMRETGTAALRRTDTRRRVGFSIDYSAPEQWNSKRYGAMGPWTDVYAFALVLVEVLSGKRALDVDDDAEDMEYGTATTSDERPTPSARGAAVPPSVEAVFLKALAIKPGERFASARAFWDALREAAGLSPTSTPTPPPPTSKKAKAKKPISTSLDVPEFDLAGVPAVTEPAHPGELPTEPAPVRTPPDKGKAPLETALHVPEFEGAGKAVAKAQAQRPRAASPSRAPLYVLGALGLVGVVGVVAGLTSSRSTPPHEAPLPAAALVAQDESTRWAVGQVVELDVTLRPTDRGGLSCASSEEVAGKHCEFDAPDKPSAKGNSDDDKKVLKAYSVPNSPTRILAAGLWTDPGMSGTLPEQRFTVRCKFLLEGKVNNPSVRWDPKGPWRDMKSPWFVATTSSCTIHK
jgi:serine/threonine-protein kinase